jgi:aerobic C4-dicarboxylate transport protein
VSQYAGQAKEQTVTTFLLNIIPTTVVDAFARGNMLQVILVSVLFGIAMAALGAKAKPVIDLMDKFMKVIFGVVDALLEVCPCRSIRGDGVHGGTVRPAFTRAAGKLIGTFWLTSTLFVLVVLGRCAGCVASVSSSC